MTSDPVRIAHLTDLHIRGDESGRIGGVDSFAALTSVLAAMARDPWRPDLVVATGDLSDDGSAASYRRLRDLLGGLGVPVYCIAGNHDLPDAMGEHLAGGMIRLDRRVALGAWQLVMLDSRVPERGHGHLADEELAALDEALSADAGLHTLIGLHHGPVTACPMPLCQLDNAGELFGLLRRHANARAVIAGHIHCAVEHFQDGTALLATPSTCVQARHPAGPHVPDELEFSAVHELDTTRRAYRRLELFADGGIVTEVVWDTDPA